MMMPVSRVNGAERHVLRSSMTGAAHICEAPAACGTMARQPHFHPDAVSVPSHVQVFPRTAIVTSRWRWIAIAFASLMAHALALDLLPHWVLDASAPVRSEPLHATLVAVPDPLPRATPQPAAEPSAAPALTFTPTRTPVRPKRRRPVSEMVPESLDPSVASITVTPSEGKASETPTQASDASAAAANAVTATRNAATPASPETHAPAPPLAAPPIRTDPPASALLRYAVVADDMKSGTATRYYGVGSLKWTVDERRYSADIEAGIPLLLFKLKLLASHSEGTIGETGLLPDRYTEKPMKRSSLATNFNRDERRSITFSASQASLPLVDGAQDRLSVLFQLGALLRANPALATEGGHIDIPVAGVRGDVDTWSFATLGNEVIDTGAGRLEAAHLRRSAPANTNEKTIDVWIALAEGGYPARIVQTEQNGTTYDLTLEKIE